MNERPTEISHGVGGCGACRHIFLVTPEARDCPLCGRPTYWVLPFSPERMEAVEVVAPEPEAPAVVEPPVPFSITCPHCGLIVLLEVTEEAIAVVTQPAVPQTEEPGAPPPTETPPAPPPAEEEPEEEPLVTPQEGPPAEPSRG